MKIKFKPGPGSQKNHFKGNKPCTPCKYFKGIVVWCVFAALTFNTLTSVFAQVPPAVLLLTKINTLGSDVINFGVDNLGNLYLVNSTNQVKKLSEKGDSIAVFNDIRRYGNLYSIDVTNPLKVILYYKDFTTIVVLDRLLNKRNTIDLRKVNIFQVRAVATSYDGNVWVFDELDGKIKKIDDYGKVIFESTDLRVALPDSPQPNNMFDRDGLLYLYDSSKAIFVFDYYGALKNSLAIKGYTNLQVIDKNTITALYKKEIVVYKPTTLQQFTFLLPANVNNFKQLHFTNSKLYVLTNKQMVDVYSTP